MFMRIQIIDIVFMTYFQSLRIVSFFLFALRIRLDLRSVHGRMDGTTDEIKSLIMDKRERETKKKRYIERNLSTYIYICRRNKKAHVGKEARNVSLYDRLRNVAQSATIFTYSYIMNLENVI